MKDILINDIANSYFQEAFKSYFEELGISVRQWDKLFKEMNEDKDNYAYIRLSENNETIGFIQFTTITLSSWFFEENLGFIREFWIAKGYRGAGNGRDLLRLAESFFKDKGIAKSILTTDTAPEFYEKCGYMKDIILTAKNKDDVYIRNL